MNQDGPGGIERHLGGPRDGAARHRTSRAWDRGERSVSRQPVAGDRRRDTRSWADVVADRGAGGVRPARVPLSGAFRHSLKCEECNPSRRSNTPRSVEWRRRTRSGRPACTCGERPATRLVRAGSHPPFSTGLVSRSAAVRVNVSSLFSPRAGARKRYPRCLTSARRTGRWPGDGPLSEICNSDDGPKSRCAGADSVGRGRPAPDARAGSRPSRNGPFDRREK